MSGGLRFEGGDVVIDFPNIFVGISAKNSVHGIATDESFVKHVQEELPTGRVIPICLAKNVLHLDLVFNILPFGEKRGKSCVLYPDGLTNYLELIEKFKKLKLFDKVYLISKEQSDAYVCNYINTGPNQMVVSKSSKMVNLVKKWKKDSPDLKVRYVEYLWIYSYLGCSIRCSTMPVIRTQNKHDQIPPQMTVYNEIDPLRVCLVGKATPDKSTPICAAAYRVINQALKRDGNTRLQLLNALEKGLEQLVEALQQDGVIVLRPDVDTLKRIQACNVVFSRDIACVIGNKLFISDLHLEHRKDEYLAGQASITAFFGQSSLPTIPPRKDDYLAGQASITTFFRQSSPPTRKSLTARKAPKRTGRSKTPIRSTRKSPTGNNRPTKRTKIPDEEEEF